MTMMTMEKETQRDLNRETERQGGGKTERESEHLAVCLSVRLSERETHRGTETGNIRTYDILRYTTYVSAYSVPPGVGFLLVLAQRLASEQKVGVPEGLTGPQKKSVTPAAF